MNLQLTLVFALLVNLFTVHGGLLAAEAEVRRLPAAGRPGVAHAVTVPAGALLLTGQIFSKDLAGGDRSQSEGAADELRGLLAEAGADFLQVARITAYVADESAVPAVEAVVAERFTATPVAFSLVRTPLAVSGAKVAFEAVARVRTAEKGVVRRERSAVLPIGGKIFISGQAEKGTDVASAVRLTMAGLHRSLAHVGLKKSDVVQVKAFIRPFGDHDAARREVVASFDGEAAPPIVLIEWQSELFAEIELVAAAPALVAKPGETVVHSWLPWLTASPRYCNIAHVPDGVPLIFLSAVDGGTGDDRAQMKRIFERVGSVLFDAGSSYRHLAKATYYLGGAPSRGLLGDIRGVYFDPTRPPAASALQVAAFGHAGRKAEIEMIAVPVK